MNNQTQADTVPIVGFESLYTISRLGVVFSIISGRALKPYDDGRNYLAVQLWRDGGRKIFKVHRLIAAAFIPNPHGWPEINHRDGNRRNNTIENLEWITRLRNVSHASFVLNRITRKLTAECVAKIRASARTAVRWSHRHSLASIARKHGVTRGAVEQIVNNETWVNHYGAAA